MTAPWFEVDKKGLRDIVARRGLSWLVYELISNAWDEKSSKVTVQLEPNPGLPTTTIVVTDDNPDGFADLRDAWTLFASSKKKGDAEKRGRFNLGEKLVLAMCDSAVIKTTTGAVLFDHTGRHNRPKWKTATGSVFEGDLRMTRAQLAEILDGVSTLIPPIPTTVNGKLVEYRCPLIEFEAILPTEIAGEDGELKRTARKTKVYLYPPLPGETASIYEMGIPVVATGDAFHVNIMQKVPLNMERDNVTPAYLRDVRGLALAHGHFKLTDEQKHDSWVNDAIAAPTFPEDAIALDTVIEARFGGERVAFDPSDREANDLAASKGLTVVHGGSLPGDVWERVKARGLILPAGQVTPSPKPFSPEGKPLTLLDESDWPEAVKAGVEVYRWVGKKLLGFVPSVLVTKDWRWKFAACYGPMLGGTFGELTLSLHKLGEKHFTQREKIYELAIHEFAHHFEANHLSEKYHDALCKLGAQLAAFFDEFAGGERAIAEDRGIDRERLGACWRAS